MDDEIRRREMFLSGVIYSTENKNSMDRDELVLLYQDIIKECIALHYEDDKIQSFSRKFFEMMLRHNEISSDKHELALYLLCGISGTDKIAAQRGIFEALLCKMDDAGVNIVLETEFSNRLSILSWGMMFCILGSQSKNLQFLEIQKRKLYYYISRDPKCEEQLSIETLLLLWVELVKKYNREENGYVDFRFDLVYKGLGY